MSDQPVQKKRKVQDSKQKKPLYSKQNKGDVKSQIKGYLRGADGMNGQYGGILRNFVKIQENYVTKNVVKNFLYANCSDLMKLSTFESEPLVLLLMRLVWQKFDGFLVRRDYVGGKNSKWMGSKKFMDKEGRIKVSGDSNKDIDESLSGVFIDVQRVDSPALEDSKFSSIKDRDASVEPKKNLIKDKELTPYLRSSVGSLPQESTPVKGKVTAIEVTDAKQNMITDRELTPQVRSSVASLPKESTPIKSNVASFEGKIPKKNMD